MTAVRFVLDAEGTVTDVNHTQKTLTRKMRDRRDVQPPTK